MADDNGVIADIEADLVSKLAAITVNSEAIFRTADHWHFQLTGGDSFTKYAPFAFVEYQGTSRAGWEGDHDLNYRMIFTVRVGTEINQAKQGAARIGIGTDAGIGTRQLGLSRLQQEVIEAVQEQLPTTTDGDVERYEYEGDELVWSTPHQAALMMRFSIERVIST